jgi:antitoxin CptB
MNTQSHAVDPQQFNHIAVRDTSVGDPELDGLAAHLPLSARALSRLQWRSRRGLLENDLFIERFFKQHQDHLTVAHARGLYDLMDLSDNDLMDLFLQRKELPNPQEKQEAQQVLMMLRQTT